MSVLHRDNRYYCVSNVCLHIKLSHLMLVWPRGGGRFLHQLSSVQRRTGTGRRHHKARFWRRWEDSDCLRGLAIVLSPGALSPTPCCWNYSTRSLRHFLNPRPPDPTAHPSWRPSSCPRSGHCERWVCVCVCKLLLCIFYCYTNVYKHRTREEGGECARTHTHVIEQHVTWKYIATMTH